MQAIRHVLSVAVLAVVPAVTFADSAAPAAAAKSPPRAPTLVSVTPGDAGPPRASTPTGGPPFNANASASTLVDPAGTISQIQAAPLAQRDAVIREVGARMDAVQRALVALRDRMNSPGKRNGTAFVFQHVFTQVRTCDQTLRKSLQAARESKTASAWAGTQTVLIRNYSDYARAVADVEAAARSAVVSGP